MKKYFGKIVILNLLLIFSLVSCSTTLKMNVIRPAKLDLKGAKTIGVLPFEKSDRFPFYSSGLILNSKFGSYYSVSNVEHQVLDFIHSSLEKGLMKSPYVELVSSSAVQKALNGYGLNPADVYITGDMVTFNIFDEVKVVKKELEPDSADSESDEILSSELSEIKKADKPIFIYEEFYTREVLLVFNYQVVDGETDNVLFFDTLKINERSGPVEKTDDLPDPYSMISYELEDFVSSFLKMIQPYNFVRSISLLDDKTKNPQMENAHKLAKDGNLKESFDIFYNIYEENGLFEAGYNAAMILMVTGDFSGAEKLMRDVYIKTGNIKASEGLSDIMYEIRQKQILQGQIRQEF